MRGRKKGKHSIPHIPQLEVNYQFTYVSDVSLIFMPLFFITLSHMKQKIEQNQIQERNLPDRPITLGKKYHFTFKNIILADSTPK